MHLKFFFTHEKINYYINLNVVLMNLKSFLSIFLYNYIII